jgi:hypothetical protein
VRPPSRQLTSAAAPAALLAAAAMAQGCSNDAPSAATTTASSPRPIATTTRTAPAHTTATATGGRAQGTPATVAPHQEPQVAPPAKKPPGARSAPSSGSGPLRFTRVQVRPGPGGRFAGQANVTNTGATYLNDRRVRWRILGRRGVGLDRAVADLPSLAPGATTTISLTGSRRFRGSWRAVRFSLG